MVKVMILARLMLMIGVLLFAYGAAIAMETWHWLFTAALLVACTFIVKGFRKRLTTLGSARWADSSDLRRAGMLDAGSGLVLGRLEDNRRHFVSAISSLFNLRVNSLTACRQFLSALRGKMGSQLVKLNAVHTAIFCPTGGGKGVSHRDSLPSDLS